MWVVWLVVWKNKDIKITKKLYYKKIISNFAVMIIHKIDFRRIICCATLYLTSLITPCAANAQSQYTECEDTCAHVHGIDISHYQGEVFWETICNNTKMAYVYIKATDGETRIDPKYEQNVLTAHRYGLKVGSYHFYRPTINQEYQVANFFAQCKPSEQDLIPMIDVEVTGGLSTEALCDSLFKFLEMIEQVYRQRPLIYAGANFYNKHLKGKLDRYLIMIAQDSDKEPGLADGRDVTMWQYTGKGHLHGVNGYVDKSRFMGEHKLRELRFKHRKGEK